MFACPFRIERKTLIAGEMTAITPPITCSSVTISNRTDDDLEVHSDNSGTHYGIITTCFEERIDLSQSGSATSLFHDSSEVFYLKSAAGGLVVLTWT